MRRHGEAAGLRRILIAGGAGFFGRHVAGLLRAEGLDPLLARRSALDVEDPTSIRSALRPRDVIVDAVGPFQGRTSVLVETAIQVAADVVDLNDSLAYARRIALLDDRARERGIAVVSSCSAVSTVAAALVLLSGVARPVRVSALVAPAARKTASEGTVRALLGSVGRPIEILRDGRAVRAIGWREARDFTLPRRRAHLIESALSLTLPQVWPTLRSVDSWTDTGTLGANALLSLASRSAPLRRLAERALPLGILATRLVGPRRGAFAVEVEDGSGRVSRLSLGAAERSYLIACAPAALVARALAASAFEENGVVPSDRHLAPDDLLEYLDRLGIVLEQDQ